MDLSKKLIKILLAEDNDDDIVMIKDAFARSKIINSFDVVKNGEEALGFLRKEGRYAGKDRPGLILLDINMPKKNGFEVLEAIKKDPRFDYIPVIMLTTSEREEDIVKSYKEGACSYITKPVNFSNFTKVIEQFALYWALVSKIPN
jgi:CheY-like chemotaxis protein